MTEGTLFNPGFLGASFLWWVGQVADDSTWRDNILPGKHSNSSTNPGWGYRYKVRIIGLHDKEETIIRSEELPWAQVMYPITAGGGQASALQTPNIRQGNFVFGFFLDGQDMQVPVIMGVLGNNSQIPLSSVIGTTNSNFSATSGFADNSLSPKQQAVPKVPDSGLRIEKPKPLEINDRCASPPPGVKLNEFGLRPDIPLTREQLEAAKAARDAARQKGDPPEIVEREAQKAVKALIREDCNRASSSTSPPVPGATIESPADVHLVTAADIKRQEKMDEPITLLKPDNLVGSAIKGIQTELEKITKKIEKYIKAINSYADAVTSVIGNIQKIIADGACIIAKLMKIIFDKIMEYILKLLNKTLANVVAALPSSFRNLFGDIKEIIVELILCLFNKLINGLCGLLQDLLGRAFNIENLERIARERSLSGDSGQSSVPKIPICVAEDLIGQVFYFNNDLINDATNTIVSNLDAFLTDVRKEVSSIKSNSNVPGASIPNIPSIPSIGDIAGAIGGALNFENIKLNVFGCELTPNIALSDYYTFDYGSSGTPTKSKSSIRSISNFAEKSRNFSPAVNEIPYARPTSGTPNVTIPQQGTGN